MPSLRQRTGERGATLADTAAWLSFSALFGDGDQNRGSDHEHSLAVSEVSPIDSELADIRLDISEIQEGIRNHDLWVQDAFAMRADVRELQEAIKEHEGWMAQFATICWRLEAELGEIRQRVDLGQANVLRAAGASSAPAASPTACWLTHSSSRRVGCRGSNSTTEGRSGAGQTSKTERIQEAACTSQVEDDSLNERPAEIVQGPLGDTSRTYPSLLGHRRSGLPTGALLGARLKPASSPQSPAPISDAADGSRRVVRRPRRVATAPPTNLGSQPAPSGNVGCQSAPCSPSPSANATRSDAELPPTRSRGIADVRTASALSPNAGPRALLPIRHVETLAPGGGTPASFSHVVPKLTASALKAYRSHQGEPLSTGTRS
mmetsp:Transcript_87640/g.246179  ORF Transcript_87640/g.246179 Transcript_87640/m.246179 type:complete len:377 (-) Transcript_87640:114-1244(-)